MFVDMGIERVPGLGHSKPSMGSSVEARKFKKEEFWSVGNDDNVEAPKTLENLNRLMNKDVELKYTLYRILIGNFLIIGVLAAGWLMRNFLL
jgi:hypothetical protein